MVRGAGLVVLAGIAALLAGCGKAKPAMATRDYLVAQELRVFPPENLRLANNKFFLWKVEMTPEQASRAQAIARTLEELDSEAVPLNRRRLELESQMEPLQEDIRLLSKHERGMKRLVGLSERNLNKLKKEVSALEAQLEAQETGTPEATAEAQARHRQLWEKRARVAALEEQVEAARPVLEGLEEEISGLRERLEPLQQELETLEARQFEVELKGREKVEEIMEVVDWYQSPPTSVAFQFEKDGSVSAAISGWDLEDEAGPRNFSTEAGPVGVPTIRNVRYTPLGGVFEFEVLVFENDDPSRLRESYEFRISRTRYDATDGRRYFTGEITRKRQVGDQLEVRRGVAKLIDRNN